MYQGKPPPEAEYMFFAAWKVPSPLPSSSQAVQSPKLTTARSGFPSPLKSATTMPEGPFVDPAAYSVWGLNNGVCANVGFGNANRKNEVTATNNDSLPSFLFIEHQADEFQRDATRPANNQRIDYPICSPHQTNRTLTTKSLVRARLSP